MIELTKAFQTIAVGESKDYGAAKGWLEIEAKYTQEDIINNRHYVIANLNLEVTGGYIGSYQDNWKTFAVTGLKGINQAMAGGSYTSQCLATVEGWIYHDSEGKKEITLAGDASFLAWSDAMIEVKKTVKLPDIPRASSITVENNSINVGDILNIIIDKKVSSYSDNLIINFGSFTKTFENVEETISWDTSNDSEALYAEMSNTNTLVGQATINTYNEDTLVGSNTAEFTLNVVDSNPTFSNFTYEDTNPKTLGLTGNNQTVIKGYSHVKGTISTANKAIAVNGSTMSKYQLVIGEKQAEASYSETEDVNIIIENVENNVFMIYAIDSRGNSTSKQISPTTYLTYFKPKIVSMSLERGSGGVGEDVTLVAKGEFWNNSFGTEDNKLTAAYKYREIDSENWINGTTSIPITISNNSFEINQNIAGDLEGLGFYVENSYEVELIINDKLDSTNDTEKFANGKPNMSLHKKGMAFGQLFDENIDFNHQVAGKANFEEIYINKEKLERIIYETTLDEDTTLITIDNLNLEKEKKYAIYLEGQSTVSLDMYVKFNDLNTGYNQGGIYWLGSGESSNATLTANTGYRPSKVGFYYAFSLRPIATKCRMEFTIVDNKLFAEWQANSMVPASSSGGQLISYCGGYREFADETINKITIASSLETSLIKAGTKVSIVRLG